MIADNKRNRRVSISQELRSFGTEQNTHHCNSNKVYSIKKLFPQDKHIILATSQFDNQVL